MVSRAPIMPPHPWRRAPNRRNSDGRDRIELRRPFRVPLHAETEPRLVGTAHRLDETVLGEGLGLQPVGQPGDALPVQRIDHDLVAPDPVAQLAAQA